MADISQLTMSNVTVITPFCDSGDDRQAKRNNHMWRESMSIYALYTSTSCERMPNEKPLAVLPVNIDPGSVDAALRTSVIVQSSLAL